MMVMVNQSWLMVHKRLISGSNHPLANWVYDGFIMVNINGLEWVNNGLVMIYDGNHP